MIRENSMSVSDMEFFDIKNTKGVRFKEYEMKLIPITEKKLSHWLKLGYKFYCFGAGHDLIRLCAKNECLGKAIVAIGDNNKKLWEKPIDAINEDVMVQPVESIDPPDNNEVVIFATAFYSEISEQLMQREVWKKFPKAYFMTSDAEMHYYRFSKFYDGIKPKNIMLFRSGNATYVPGWDCTDNARALFDRMIELGLNEKYKMIWLAAFPCDHKDLKKIPNTKVISYRWPSEGNIFQKITYYYYLRSAKYLFFTDAMKWTHHCGKEQIRVNLWHGNGFKAKKNKKGAALDEFFEYTTVSGPVYIDLHEKYLGCKRDKIFDTGLAKEDLLFNPPQRDLSEILGIEKTKKYVFWLPTFRSTREEMKGLYEYQIDGDTGLPILQTFEKIDEINQFLREHDMSLIIKLHPIQDANSIKCKECSNIKVLTQEEVYATGYQINTLLASADALISDFSSVAVDFLLRDKPMAFVLEDLNQYEESRGFVFEPIEEYLPGKLLYNYSDMINFLEGVASGTDESYEARHKRFDMFHSHNDGGSRDRILQLLGLFPEDIK